MKTRGEDSVPRAGREARHTLSLPVLAGTGRPHLDPGLNQFLSLKKPACGASLRPPQETAIAPRGEGGRKGQSRGLEP